VCIKNLKVEMGEEAILDFEKELDFLQRTRHPQLVRFFGAGSGCLDVSSGDVERPYLVMELVARGSLKSVLRGKHRVDLTFAQRERMLHDVAAGLAYLHQLGHAHRDIKTGNVLVTEEWRTKVTDFGSLKRDNSQEILGGRGATALTTSSAVYKLEHDVPNAVAAEESMMTGTPLYLAPEILRTGRNGGFPGDVFAYGIVIWETFSGQVPDVIEQCGGSRRGPFLGTLLSTYEAGHRLPMAVLERQDWMSDAAIKTSLEHWQSTMTQCWHDDPAMRPQLSDLQAVPESTF
jgi:serine/threonine protein kinase